MADMIGHNFLPFLLAILHNLRPGVFVGVVGKKQVAMLEVEIILDQGGGWAKMPDGEADELAVRGFPDNHEMGCEVIVHLVLVRLDQMSETGKSWAIWKDGGKPWV